MDFVTVSEHKNSSDAGQVVKQLCCFFVLAYALMFGTVLGTEYHWISLPAPLRTLLSVGSPTVSALAVALVFEGWKGVKGILVQYLRFRAPIRWYLFGIVFFIVPLVYGLGRARLGYTDPKGVSFAVLPAVVLITFIVGPLSEEGGWRGYALPRLNSLMAPHWAGLLIGLLWGTWHLPFWFVEGSYQRQIPFIGYLAAATFLGIIYTRVYLASNGSLLPVILLHFWINLAGALLLRRTLLLTNAEFLLIEFVLALTLAAYYFATRRGWSRRPD